MKTPVLLLVLTIIVGAPVLGAKEVEEPIFVQWMSPTRAKDQTILTYWEKVKTDELSSEGLIDLGTMLFRRGFPNDAIDMYELALDKNKENPEAWYRIGLVEHKKGNLGKAESAYEHCLKLMSGHGWCNFYLGYLEEYKGQASKALEHYATAFRHAPELADPEVNPEVLYSKLYVAALVKHTEDLRFARAMPMPYLEPGKVHGTTKRMKRSIDAQREKTESKDDAASTAAELAQSPVGKAPETSSAKKYPQRRRPQHRSTAPVPEPSPDAEPDRPPEEKPPADPNAR